MAMLKNQMVYIYIYIWDLKTLSWIPRTGLLLPTSTIDKWWEFIDFTSWSTRFVHPGTCIETIPGWWLVVSNLHTLGISYLRPIASWDYFGNPQSCCDILSGSQVGSYIYICIYIRTYVHAYIYTCTYIYVYKYMKYPQSDFMVISTYQLRFAEW